MKTTYRTGLMAEALCRFALRMKGYRIVASRYRSRLGEINIIVARGHTVALVEVKACANRRAALEAVQPRQRVRLGRAAQEFLARFPHLAQHSVGFDVMLVAPYTWAAHIADAWWPE